MSSPTATVCLVAVVAAAGVACHNGARNSKPDLGPGAPLPSSTAEGVTFPPEAIDARERAKPGDGHSPAFSEILQGTARRGRLACQDRTLTRDDAGPNFSEMRLETFGVLRGTKGHGDLILGLGKDGANGNHVVAFELHPQRSRTLWPRWAIAMPEFRPGKIGAESALDRGRKKHGHRFFVAAGINPELHAVHLNGFHGEPTMATCPSAFTAQVSDGRPEGDGRTWTLSSWLGQDYGWEFSPSLVGSSGLEWERLEPIQPKLLYVYPRNESAWGSVQVTWHDHRIVRVRRDTAPRYEKVADLKGEFGMTLAFVRGKPTLVFAEKWYGSEIIQVGMLAVPEHPVKGQVRSIEIDPEVFPAENLWSLRIGDRQPQPFATNFDRSVSARLPLGVKDDLIVYPPQRVPAEGTKLERGHTDVVDLDGDGEDELLSLARGTDAPFIVLSVERKRTSVDPFRVDWAAAQRPSFRYYKVEP